MPNQILKTKDIRHQCLFLKLADTMGANIYGMLIGGNPHYIAKHTCMYVSLLVAIYRKLKLNKRIRKLHTCYKAMDLLNATVNHDRQG